MKTLTKLGMEIMELVLVLVIRQDGRESLQKLSSCLVSWILKKPLKAVKNQHSKKI